MKITKEQLKEAVTTVELLGNGMHVDNKMEKLAKVAAMLYTIQADIALSGECIIELKAE